LHAAVPDTDLEQVLESGLMDFHAISENQRKSRVSKTVDLKVMVRKDEFDGRSDTGKILF